MKICTLKLTNFRNFKEYKLEPERVTILVGPNGVGKTNIVEAMYLASVCRSYRTRRDSEVIYWGEQVARVSVSLTSEKGDALQLAIAQDGDKKIAFVGDKVVPVSLVVGRMPTVLFAPEIMELPVDLPAKRRRQLDIFASQLKPNYTRLLLHYHRILKARNKLLDGIAAGRNRENELDFWEKELVEYGQKILNERLAIVKLLDQEIGTCFKRLDNSAAKGERVLRYRYEKTVTDPSQYADDLQTARGRDVRYRNTTIGPHRDDWQLYFNERSLRLSASRGETRAALLALKMAEMSILESEKGETPILLLDDVFAELDRHHSEALIDFVGDAQVLVTATDAEYIPEAFRDGAKIIEL